MDTSQFNKDKLKRQRNREGWRVIIAFVISLLFIAALMFFSSVLDVWGQDTSCPSGANGRAAAAAYCGSTEYYTSLSPSQGYSQQQDGKCLICCCRYHEGGNLDACRWCVYGKTCVRYQHGATEEPEELETATPTATPTPTGGSPSDTESTATPTATRSSSNSPSGQPPAISTSTSMPPALGPTRTPTPTPTLLIIYPSRTPGAPPPSAGPDMGGTPAPTATPEPFWSPCLLQHAGAPVNLCETGSGSGWWLYFFGPGGQVRTGPYVPRYGGPVDKIFFSVTSPTTGKPVLVQWIAKYQAVRVITYYDHHPYAGHKPYIFDVLPGDRVVYQRW